MQTLEVYTKSEKFKFGWTAGLYDARSDDGMRYLDDILRYGVRSDDDQSFMEGYRAGQRARRNAVMDNAATPTPVQAAA
jgi:hypothetical protein